MCVVFSLSNCTVQCPHLHPDSQECHPLAHSAEPAGEQPPLSLGRNEHPRMFNLTAEMTAASSPAHADLPDDVIGAWPPLSCAVAALRPRGAKGWHCADPRILQAIGHAVQGRGQVGVVTPTPNDSPGLAGTPGLTIGLFTFVGFSVRHL